MSPAAAASPAGAHNTVSWKEAPWRGGAVVRNRQPVAAGHWPSCMSAVLPQCIRAHLHSCCVLLHVLVQCVRPVASIADMHRHIRVTRRTGDGCRHIAVLFSAAPNEWRPIMHSLCQLNQRRGSRYFEVSIVGRDALNGCHSMTEMAGTLMNMYMPGLHARSRGCDSDRCEVVQTQSGCQHQNDTAVAIAARALGNCT